MKKENHRPFIPRDKPKSWVVYTLSILTGLLVAGPIIFLGSYVGLPILEFLGKTMFVICLLSAFISWSSFTSGMKNGKYRNIKEQDWNKQLW